MPTQGTSAAWQSGPTLVVEYIVVMEKGTVVDSVSPTSAAKDGDHFTGADNLKKRRRTVSTTKALFSLRRVSALNATVTLMALYMRIAIYGWLWTGQVHGKQELSDWMAVFWLRLIPI